MQSCIYKGVVGGFLLGSALLGACPQAHAAVVSGASSGYGLDVDVTALLLVNLNVGPAPAGIGGMAPAAYNLSQSVLLPTVTSSVPLVASGTVGADIVHAIAMSDVDGLPGSRSASATGGVVNAGVNFVTLPAVGNGDNILGINGTLSSSSLVQGDYGAFSVTANTVIESLSLQIGPTVVDLSAFVGVSVPPNTTVDLNALGIVGATLVLNEQTLTGDGLASRGVSVNAFHLSLNVLGALGVTGEVILGHSDASLVAVPEPASGVAILFAATVATLGRRRRGS